jgi:hypothetical protein
MAELGNTYKTILVDTDNGSMAPVLVVGVEGEEVFITIAKMSDRDSGLRLKNITPEITVNIGDLLRALGMVAQVKVEC